MEIKNIPRSNHDQRLEETNIFPAIFEESLIWINPGVVAEDIKRVLEELTIKLNYDDLGRYFYKTLIATSGIRIIDFNNFDNNSFHITTELTCKNGDDEFLLDVTVLINGMPLIFIEVKKLNNKEGVLAERKSTTDIRTKSSSASQNSSVNDLLQ